MQQPPGNQQSAPLGPGLSAESRRKQEQRRSRSVLAPMDVWTGPDRPYAGASGAAGGVDARRWRNLSSNPAMSAASTPAPSATIQTFEPSLAGRWPRSGARRPLDAGGRQPSSPTPGSVLAGRGVSRL